VGSDVVVVVRAVGEGILKLGAAGVDFGPKEFVPKLVKEAFDSSVLP
jgi:hypothetical protein